MMMMMMKTCITASVKAVMGTRSTYFVVPLQFLRKWGTFLLYRVQTLILRPLRVTRPR